MKTILITAVTALTLTASSASADQDVIYKCERWFIHPKFISWLEEGKCPEPTGKALVRREKDEGGESSRFTGRSASDDDKSTDGKSTNNGGSSSNNGGGSSNNGGNNGSSNNGGGNGTGNGGGGSGNGGGDGDNPGGGDGGNGNNPPAPPPTDSGKVKSDNSDANGKGGNKHNRADKDQKPAHEIAEDKKANKEKSFGKSDQGKNKKDK